MTTFKLYDSRAGRYWNKTVQQLERLERQHQDALEAAINYDGYYPERKDDIEKHARLLSEIRAVRESKIMQHALL